MKKRNKEKKGKRILGTKVGILFLVLSLLPMLPLAAAAATTISIEDVTNMSPGESVTIPIMITDVADVGVAAIVFSYNPSVVHVTAVTDSQFDVCDPTINNVTGEFEIGGVQFWSPGLNGNVQLANVTLKAVGTAGQSSPLNITITELKTVGPPPENIPADVDNGSFTMGGVPQVVINEFIPDPEGDDDAPMPDGEWVELYNKGDTEDINVSGCVLYDSNDTHELYITSENTNTGDTIVPASGWLVVYRDGDSDFSLNRNDDEVRLYDGYPVADSNLIDETSYANSTTEKSWARIPDGTGDFVEAYPPTPGASNIPKGISKIVFITDPQTIMAGEPSDVMTIQTQDEYDNPANVEANTTIELSSDSGTGTFSLTADPWEEVTEVTIIAGGNMASLAGGNMAGGNMASFYYKDVTVGTPTLTAAESPDQNWTDATQEQTINPAEISKIVFTTDPQEIMAGEPSDVMTIQTQDEYDNPSNVEANTTVELSSDSGTGTFSLAADPWEEVTEVTIIAGGNTASLAGGNMAGGNMASFYYKDVTVGTPTLTAAESPDQNWTDATQQQTIVGVEISKIVFVTDPQEIMAGEPSNVMTIQTQDESGNPANVEANTTINLSSDSETGTFSLTADPWEEVTEVTIIAGGNMAGGNMAGGNMASFYYKDVTVGTPTLTAAESPDQNWTDATQEQTINPAEISKLVFITDPQTINVSEPSDVMTIQTQDEYDNPSNVEANTTIELSSDSETGTFSLTTDPWEEVTEVTIIAGGNMASGNMASFYYKDMMAGTPEITAVESPDQNWTDATQEQNVSVVGYDFVIKLSSGGHLISIPWYIDPSDVQTIREAQGLNFSICEYNTATRCYETPDKLQPLHGYWINMYEAGTIGFNKSKELQQVPPSRLLKEGCNLIGPSFGNDESLKEGLDATTVLSSLREGGYTTFSHLTLYNETTGEYTTYDATVKWEDLYEAWNGLKLYPGQGCWIGMVEDDLLTGRL